MYFRGLSVLRGVIRWDGQLSASSLRFKVASLATLSTTTVLERHVLGYNNVGDRETGGIFLSDHSSIAQ